MEGIIDEERGEGEERWRREPGDKEIGGEKTEGNRRGRAKGEEGKDKKKSESMKTKTK